MVSGNGIHPLTSLLHFQGSNALYVKEFREVGALGYFFKLLFPRPN